MRRALSVVSASVSLLALGSLAPGADPAKLRVVRCQRGEVIRYVALPATIRANQQATLYAKVAGYITTIAADKGQSVKQGELLAEIEVPELAADLKRYQADAKVAQIELERLTEAQKKARDLVLPQALDKARGALDSANASTERTETLLRFAKIAAPFSGIITMRYMDTGAFVPAATTGSTPQNSALFTLMDFSTVRVQTGVPELEVPLVHEGQPVKVTLEELPTKIFEGKVTRFAYALDEASRTMLVEIDLPNPDRALRPGMYATAKIGIEKHDNALLIPLDALVIEKGGAFVFRHVDGKAKKTAVTTGFNDGANCEIVAGVDEGAQVIVAGKAMLADGQSVQILDAQ